MTPNKLQPALLGGAFIGVLSVLPVINLANCCCLWIIGGGMLAAYLTQQNQPTAIQIADGAIVGLLAGLVGGVVAGVLSIPIQMVTQQAFQPMFERMLDRSQDLPPEMRRFFEGLASNGGVAFRVLGLLVGIVIDTIFATLGGVLGAAIFKKGPPPSPPGTIDVPSVR